MPEASPLAASYVELDGANSSISFPDKLQYKPGAKGSLTLHAAFIDWPASGTATIFGKDTVGQRLQVTSTGIVSFVSIRAGGTVTTTATVALSRGAEYVLHGIDDGLTVKLYVNGTQVGTTGTAQTGLLTKDTNAFYVGQDVADAVLTRVRVYGFAMRLDDEVVGRWTVLQGAGSTVPDRSSFKNDAAIAGTIDTQFRYASAWQGEPQWPGKGTL